MERLVLVVLAIFNRPATEPTTPSVKPPAPCTAKVLATVVAPVTLRVPPRVVAPVPTVNVLALVIETLPFSVAA